MRELLPNEQFCVSGGSDWSDGTMGGDKPSIDWAGLLNDIVNGLQIAISDCANGAEVGAVAGAAIGAVPAGIGIGPGAMAGGAVGCIVNTGIGIVRTATGQPT